MVADGLGEQADKDVFIIGPTGLALAPDGTLYASDAIDNRIVAIPDAATRTTSAGTGREVTRDGMLKRPLALALAPGKARCSPPMPRTARWWRSTRRAAGSCRRSGSMPTRRSSPPGSGDLFGLAMASSGDGFYYVRGRHEHARARARRAEGAFPLTARCPFASRRGFLSAAGGSRGRRRRRAGGACGRRRRTGSAPRDRVRPGPLSSRSTGRTRAASPQRRRTTPISPPSISTREAGPRSRRCCARWTEAAVAPHRRGNRGAAGPRPLRAGARHRRGDRPGAGPAHTDLRLRPRPVRAGRARPLRSRRTPAGGAGRSAALQRRPARSGALRR